jgi:hypothetical protein
MEASAKRRMGLSALAKAIGQAHAQTMYNAMGMTGFTDDG